MMVNVVVDSGRAIYVNGTRITDRSTKWGVKQHILEFECQKESVVSTLAMYDLYDVMQRIDTEPYLSQFKMLTAQREKHDRQEV